MLKSALPVLAFFLLAACTNHALHTASSPEGFSGEQVRLIGRFEQKDGEAAFTWPGSALAFRFEGTEAGITIASNGRVRFEVDVDGVVADLWVEEGERFYTLASGLQPGRHDLRLTRLTESFSLVTRFTQDPQVDGKLLAAPAAPQRRLLAVGDSITAGYGVEGESYACHYAPETSNQQLTYAALAAEALNADLHSIAWSGIGAWRSYGEEKPVNPTILERYQRTLADDPESRWDVARYQPDAITIAIGTNDYWQGSVTDEYQLRMISLIDRVQRDYPGKPIYLIVSPMLSGAARDDHKARLTALEESQVHMLDLGKIEPADGYGCDYHPNLTTQRRAAQALTQRLRTDLNW